MTLAIVCAILLATLAGALGYRRARGENTLTEWAVGGRSLGTLIFWFMNAGEVYTFAVLGISGYAWALGAPAYLAFCSVSLSYAVGYWLMPRIWRAGRQEGFVTQADYFAARYEAPWLGVLTGVIGIASLVIYVQIQLISLGLIVRLTLGSDLSTVAATLIAAALMIAFVFIAGLRSAAFAAGVKDVLMIVVVVVLSATVAGKVGAASLLDIFHMADQAYPGIGAFPGKDPASPTTSVWLMTSAVNIALGNWVSAPVPDVLFGAKRHRHQAQRRGSRCTRWRISSSSCWALPRCSRACSRPTTISTRRCCNSSPRLSGVGDRLGRNGVPVGAGARLPVAAVGRHDLHAQYRAADLRALSEAASLRLSRAALVCFAALAAFLSISDGSSLVRILLNAYAAIGMLAPPVFLGFLWRRATAYGVLAGLVAGFVALLAPFASSYWSRAVPEWEPGLIAMAINALVLIAVSLLTPMPRPSAVAIGIHSTSPRVRAGNQTT